MPNYFQDETPEVLANWDGHIYLRSVKDRLDWMELTQPLPCGDGFIPAGYKYNGASSGIFRHIPFFSFAKWRHPIATCRHDWRCGLVVAKEQRKIADDLFKRDIKLGQTNKLRSWWEQTKGYLGVRAGALFACRKLDRIDKELERRFPLSD